MNDLADHVADYLRLRRALGFKLVQPGNVLPQFVGWLDARQITTITVEAALAWTHLAKNLHPISLSHRLGAVRGFAAYMRTIDPATQIPPKGIFCTQQRQPSYIYTDQEITRLLEATHQLHPALRADTYRTLFGLLAATGMRVGEALRLERADVNVTDGVLTIRHPKFDRDRLVPLHPSLTELLNDYATRRDQANLAAQSETFIVSTQGKALSPSSVNDTFRTLAAAAGFPTDQDTRPRIHDLRHSFAVQTLIEWWAVSSFSDSFLVDFLCGQAASSAAIS